MRYYLISYLQIWPDGYTCAFNTAIDTTPTEFIIWFYKFQEEQKDPSQRKNLVLLNSTEISKKECREFNESSVNRNGIMFPVTILR